MHTAILGSIHFGHIATPIHFHRLFHMPISYA